LTLAGEMLRREEERAKVLKANKKAVAAE
jgi:hypothetical protein